MLLNEKLRMLLAILRRARFGRSFGKARCEIDQLELLLGDFEEGDAGPEASDGQAPSASSPKKPSRTRALAQSSAA